MRRLDLKRRAYAVGLDTGAGQSILIFRKVGCPMDFMLRVFIAISALGLAAMKLFLPEMKVDLTLLAFLVIAAIAMFGPKKFPLKGLDLGGVKVEFPGQAVTTEEPAGAASLAGSALPVPDTYMQRFLKLTPTEMIAAYAVVMAMVKSPSGGLQIPQLPWIVFAIFVVMTPFVFQGLHRVPQWQSLLTTVAFVAWALIMPGPFASIPHYDPLYGALVFVVLTVVLPLVVTQKDA
jgi:hypothetical protein